MAALGLPLAAPRALATPVPGLAAGADANVALSAAIEPQGAPLVVSTPAQTVQVTDGVTVEAVAREYHVDVAVLRWANNLGEGREPKAGSSLLVPPGPGALVRVLSGERPSHVAARMGMDPRVILDYNNLTRDAPLPGGTYLQVPAAAGGRDALLAGDVVPLLPGIPAVSAAQRATGADIFPYGQCTYYVASRRNVTWTGNAWEWWAAAHGIRPEGHVPVVNAIVVMDTGWAGHVGIVDHVNPDGSFVMSEMNYFGNGGGWGRVDQRILTPDEPWIMGFIY